LVEVLQKHWFEYCAYLDTLFVLEADEREFLSGGIPRIEFGGQRFLALRLGSHLEEESDARQLTGVRGFRRRTILRLLKRADEASERLLRYLVRAVPTGDIRSQVSNLRRERIVWRMQKRSRLAIVRDTYSQLILALWPLWVGVGAAVAWLYSHYAFVLFVLAAILGATGHAVFRRCGRRPVLHTVSGGVPASSFCIPLRAGTPSVFF
jgi:hypothetical protein